MRSAAKSSVVALARDRTVPHDARRVRMIDVAVMRHWQRLTMTSLRTTQVTKRRPQDTQYSRALNFSNLEGRKRFTWKGGRRGRISAPHVK